jgi:hypothetical protein
LLVGAIASALSSKPRQQNTLPTSGSMMRDVPAIDEPVQREVKDDMEKTEAAQVEQRPQYEPPAGPPPRYSFIEPGQQTATAGTVRKLQSCKNRDTKNHMLIAK